MNAGTIYAAAAAVPDIFMNVLLFIAVSYETLFRLASSRSISVYLGMKTFHTITAVIMLAGFALILPGCTSTSPDGSRTSWKEEFKHDLDLLGHRNWILVVDKAFPEQSSTGMKYFYVAQDLPPTLEYVLRQLDSSTHVRPVIYRDRELSYITDAHVAGIMRFKQDMDKILGDREVQTLLHDDVFAMLDESAALFRVLVIKTACTLPYTSVFIRLDCAYWGDGDERALRERMAVPD
jgi:hypothetical protein